MTAAIVAMTLVASGDALVASTARSGPAGVVEPAGLPGPARPTGPAGLTEPVGLTRPAGAPSVAAPGGISAPPYRGPLAGGLRVLTPFNPPAERYGRGHLGVDLAAVTGVAVLAASAGTVRFAGPVAGRGVVVLVHPDGVSTEYEPVTAVVTAGQRVRAGQRIGVTRGAHRSCAAAPCLHWGARRGGAYLDPLSLLRPLGVVRLLPWN
jgi:murein DD-endopeptidase MepM/ murein hydrolase activator NlpD